MGSVGNKNYIVLTCCSNRSINQKDFIIQDKIHSHFYINKIIKLQSIIKGFLLRKKLYLNQEKNEKKEISLDYKTDDQENNPLIIRLNNLLPKFELSEKETYYINNTNLKIRAFKYNNNSIYKGMINNNNLREGFGKLYLPDGSIYKGFFHNNKMEGRGRFLNINGYVYEGEFKNNLSDGYGKYIALDGTTYKGSWSEDKQSGLGDICYPDGSRYTGNFKNGKKHGFGKLIFSDLNTFEGNFVNNEIKGEGSYHWKDGRFFVGNWSNNKMNGYGIFIWPDKKRYYGHYADNLKEGFGKFIWDDGHSYEGFWKDGKQDGNGIIKNNNNFKYCFWNKGKLIKIIEDEESKYKIKKMIEDIKNSKEYQDFEINIKKYEKKITENSSGYETGRDIKKK
jgi:hypothetical protein